MSAPYRKPVLATVLLATLCVAEAQEAKSQARVAAVADGVSSVAGIAMGAPLSPLLPVLGLAVKAVTFEHAESLPENERPRAYAFAAAGWQGSAAANACAALSALSGGSFLPACVVVGVAWGWKTWDDGERERQDAEHCAALGAAARKRELRCASLRDPAGSASAPARAFVAAQDLVAP